MDDDTSLWVVLIEADGAQLPSKYYRRREELALVVRGDRSLGPVARRDGGAAVIFQEGAVICASYWLAREFMWMTEDAFNELPPSELDGRSPTVRIGRLRLEEGFTRSREDVQVLERIESILGKRGRKPEPQNWVVSCTECMRVTFQESWNPLNCTNCGSPMIHIRKGKASAYSDPGGDVLEAWKRTRFTGPHWEPADIVPDAPKPPARPEILGDKEREAVELIGKSADLDYIREMPRDVAFQFLDAMMIARAYRSREQRLSTRVQVVTSFLERGGNHKAISLVEPPAPDLIDTSNALPMSMTLTWMMAKAGESSAQGA